LAAEVGAESMMTNSRKTGIGLAAVKSVVCLVTLLTAMPAFAQTSSPSAAVRTSCFVGSKVTIDQQIVGCTAVIDAQGTGTKDRAGAYLIRGADYLNRSEIDRAIADFNELIRIDPNSSAGLINRGEAYRRKGELDLAIADLTRHRGQTKESLGVVQPRDRLQRQGRSGSRHRRLQPGDPAQFTRRLVLQ